MSQTIPLFPAQHTTSFLICGQVIAINKSHQPIKMQAEMTNEIFEIGQINPFLGKVAVGSQIVCLATAEGLIAVMQSITVDDNAPQISLDKTGFNVQHGHTQLEVNANTVKVKSEELHLQADYLTNMQSYFILANCNEEFINSRRQIAEEIIGQTHQSHVGKP